jgi:hypothetical protein
MAQGVAAQFIQENIKDITLAQREEIRDNIAKNMAEMLGT